MEFKLRPISAHAPLVNAGLGLCVLAILAACSGGDKATEIETGEPAPQATSIVELPAVWSTTALDGPVTDISLAGGLRPMLAVAYERSGLQLFDLEAERLAETAPYTLRRLAAGHTVSIDGADLTVFPGIDRNSELKGYVFGEGLVAPVEVSLNIDQVAPVRGLCSAALGPEDGGLFRLAYWTEASDTTLHIGQIFETGGEFAWRPETPRQVDAPIETCSWRGEQPVTSAEAYVDSALLERSGYQAVITLSESGALVARQGTGEAQRLLVNNGISVAMPDEPVAVAALGTALRGGYGGGLIVAAGPVGGESRAVFIAADNLTGVTASDQ